MSETPIRTNIINAINDYFRSPQWSALEDRLENDKEKTFHAHIFVNTTLHPTTFSNVLKAYYRTRKMEVDRPIDLQPSNVGHNMLHGIHPSGTFHFDLAWKYKAGVIIEPMEEDAIKEKNNLQIWDEKITYDFFKQFDFVTHPTAEQQKDIAAFFTSSVWDENRGYVLDKNIAHFHMNIETCLHPDIIRDAGLAAIKKEGWTVQKLLHCLFSPYKGWTTGKVVYLMDTPRVMFDIAWKFNPDVTIRSSQVPFMGVTPGKNGFDVRYNENMDFFTDAGEFITLTDAELKELEGLFAK